MEVGKIAVFVQAVYVLQDYPKYAADIPADVLHFCFAEECLEETPL
jgi:hypothetical protein